MPSSLGTSANGAPRWTLSKTFMVTCFLSVLTNSTVEECDSILLYVLRTLGGFVDLQCISSTYNRTYAHICLSFSTCHILHLLCNSSTGTHVGYNCRLFITLAVDIWGHVCGWGHVSSSLPSSLGCEHACQMGHVTHMQGMRRYTRLSTQRPSLPARSSW